MAPSDGSPRDRPGLASVTTAPRTERARREQEDIALAVAGQTICSLFQEQVVKRGDDSALVTKRDGVWTPVTWRQYGERVRAAALGLMDLGLRLGQAVALLSGTREEYNVADLGVTHAGGITVTLYQTLAPAQVAYIVDHSEAVLAFVESAVQAEKFFRIRGEIPRVRKLILFEGAEAFPGEPWIIGFDALLARGAALARNAGAAFEERHRAVGPDQLVTIIYTSGTTGPPKGVMLTHGQVCRAQESSHRRLHPEPGGRSIGYLPMAHLAERNLSLWSAIRAARTIHFCPAIERLGETLKEVRPTLFFGPPRIWEKMHAALMAGIEAEPNPASKAAVYQALEVGQRAVALQQAGQPVPADLADARRHADAVVFRRFRERLGLDEVKIAASGAAPIAAEVLRFFHAIGIPILEVYGLTEGCAVGTIVRPDRIKIGTVGLAYPGVELRLAEDGEILLRSGHVFAGYYKDPDLTREAVDADGWLHSGDIGCLDANGFLTIVDRKKDIIITAGGKNISPSNLENALKHRPLIGQAMVVGDRRPYLVALLTLDEAAVRQWAEARGLNAEDWMALLANPTLRAELQRSVDAVNAEVSRVEQIKRFAVLPQDWTSDTGELTPTLKVRRQVVLEKYATEVDALYAEH
jgi:long-chain acyl-CoA synthetase